MSFISWIFSDPKYKAFVLRIPTDMDHAIETIKFINDVEKEDVILTALDEYLRKNLWSPKETGNRTQINRLKQMRK